MAVRRIPKNYLNVTGRLAHGPNSEQSDFESLLEKDYLLALQFDPSVEYFEVQPVHVPVPGHAKPYTPDVLVRYKPGPRGGQFRPALVEVKPRELLARKVKEFAPKFKAAKSFARAQGWTFRILTEIDIRNQRLENIKFLREFRRRPIEREKMQAVLDHLQALSGCTTSATLVKSLEPSGDLESVAAWYPVVWRLVYDKKIEIDLDAPMAESVPLWIPRRSDR